MITISILQWFTKKKSNATDTSENIKPKTINTENNKTAVRKGEIGEYKIDLQLSQFPKEYKYLSDLFLKNEKSSTGYSQIDHIILTPYGIFVIETKNYQGTIYGGKDRKTWLVNGKFKMLNPLVQNYGHIQALKPFIDSSKYNYIVSMISFTKRCTFKLEPDLRKITSNELVVYDIELSEFINRKVSVNKLQNKNPLLSDVDIENIYSRILSNNIGDLNLREQHIKLISEKNTGTFENEKYIATCTVCGKSVSEKVKAYCLSNKKFNGNIYCFEHQKNI